MNPGLKKIAWLIIKTVIAVVSIWFIYRKVITRPDFYTISDHIIDAFHEPAKVKLFAFLIFMMFTNWALETAKWKLLLQKIKPTGWMTCFRSVMSGVTVSIFTPNRTGEFAGRVLHLDAGIRIKAAIASVIGSMNQLLITIIAGGIGLITSLHTFGLDGLIVDVLPYFTIVVIAIAIYMYFKIPGITKLAQKFTILRRLNLYTSVFEKYTFTNLMQLSFLSTARYLVFSFQFIIMLHWFDIAISWHEALKIISLIYLVMAFVPSIALSELTIRGSVALFFFSAHPVNSTGVVAATSIIWFVNLVIPALLGALSAFYFRFNK